MAEGKEHLSIVICGHVDSGKSTTTGRLLFELGGIPERELEKLKEEAAALGKQSFAFAFYMDRQKEERERGVTIACTTKEFFTDKWHYTIIDAPGGWGCWPRVGGALGVGWGGKRARSCALLFLARPPPQACRQRLAPAKPPLTFLSRPRTQPPQATATSLRT
jgi:hypothetical protein